MNHVTGLGDSAPNPASISNVIYNLVYLITYKINIKQSFEAWIPDWREVDALTYVPYNLEQFPLHVKLGEMQGSIQVGVN